MFTERQLRILDEIDPYIDGQEGESRKGQAQMYPLIQVKEGEYWCNKSLDFQPVPVSLIGDWICAELVSEYYYDTWKQLRDFNWKRAKQVEVTTTKWVACD